MSARRAVGGAPGSGAGPRLARLRAARGWIAASVSVALIATIAVVASGYDARETPRAEPSVWVTREAGQYARVNTDTGEIDTVRKAAEPSGVLQFGGAGVVLSDGNGRAWPIDATSPADLGDGDAGEAADAMDSTATASTADAAIAADDSTSGAVAGAAVRLPDGARDVLAAGRFAVVRTEAGAVYLGELAGPASGAVAAGAVELAARLTALRQLDPRAEEVAEPAAGAAEDAETLRAGERAAQLGFRADAVALDADGAVVMYSAAEGRLARFDAARDAFVGGVEGLPAEARGIAEPQLALVAGDWALLDAEGGRLWREDADPVDLALAGTARLQASGAGTGDGDGAATGTAALIADTAGLWRVAPGGAVERIAEADGAPAQPAAVGAERYAAWLGQSGGALWRSGETQTVPLDFDESVREPGEVEPAIRSNGERAVLGEARTGMLWTLPEGRLIPLSQWSISDPPKQDQGTVVVEEVTEQIAPTAVDDAFGVRPGEPAPLPVLLNDFDANRRDVLTIVPESLGEAPLPAAFGTVELTADGQSLVIRPAADAVGTASFGYRVTDGALASELATVTVTVAGDEVDTAPEWCPVAGCQRSWAVPAIAPGGTLVSPILEGWVDPEGDPMLLAGVELLRPEDPARAIVTADGRLAVRHTDANAGASEIMLRVTVRDGRGEERQRELQVPVRPDAEAEFQPTAATVQVDRPTVLRPLDRVAGGSGSFVLSDAVMQSGGEAIRVAVQPSGTIEVTANAAGEAIVSVGIRDAVTGSEVTGLIRLTATPGGSAFALPPLRAFVRPQADTTVEVLDAIPGAAARSLAVQGATVADGDLTADVLGHARVRLSGSTADGAPGRIGAVDIAVSDGAAQAVGRLTVFQVAEAGAAGAIAVADSASVRAGSVVDIRVLDNDVAPPGERLILHPEITGSGTAGELAFASGGVLRYLAPETPGLYRLSYTSYGASTPEASDTGEVTVTVLPRGANREPQPSTLAVRVAPGESAQVGVPLSGVDPDGDRVRLVGVGRIDDAQLSASLTTTGDAISVSASAEAGPGTRSLAYTVRDDSGGTATGTLRVIVVAAGADTGAPVASSDYARLALGGTTPVTIRPLDNDVDPAGGVLRIVDVEPNLPGGSAHPDSARLRALLDTSGMAEGVVTALPGDALGTVSYRYTVQSSETSSTSDGLILVQTSERVGTQAPAVTDTVLNVRDRGDLVDAGVDVVTDKVRWSGGDVASLELSLWEGERGGYRVEGTRILGEYRPDGDLVVFRLSGVDATGAEVSSYGFLIVPPLDELRVTLRPGLAPLGVDEGKSAETDVRSLVDLGPGDRIELRQGSFGVSRGQARCEAVSAGSLRYTAGTEGPWSDTCLVEVRLLGQRTWTVLPVPVAIVPRQPVVQLTPATRTVAPGGAETIDLLDLIEWQGGRAGDAAKLRFDVSGGGSLFQVRQTGDRLTVEARADAKTGGQEAVSVTVSGAGESRASLTLRIGEAPRDAPRGAAVQLRCTVGSSCTTQLVGVPGEYDPFAGKTGGGLTLESVSGAGCTFGRIARAGDRGITVSWPDSRGPGGQCTVGFTVRDAQGRVGEGSIEFDAQGVPRAPASISQTGFTGTSVAFTVSLASQAAHPAVTEVRVTGAGSSSCAPAGPSSYQCTVSGLENGAPHEFTAQAINAVGASDAGTSVRAWAYRTPAEPEITLLETVSDPSVTASRGMVEFSLSGGDDVAGYLVAIGGETVELSGREQTRVRRAAPVGAQQLAVTPLSRFEPPRGAAKDGAQARGSVTVAGSPTAGALALGSPDSRTVTAQLPGAGQNFSSHDLRYAYRYSGASGSPDPCPAEGAEEVSATFSGLERYRLYQVRACVYNGFGVAETTGTIRTGTGGGGAIPQPSGGLSYAIAPAATVSGGAADYALASAPAPIAAEGAVIQYRRGGTILSDFALDPAVARTIEVRQCFDTGDEGSCSDWLALSWSGAPTLVLARLTGVCVDPANPGPAIQISAAAAADAQFAAADDGTLTVSWSGQFAGLDPVALSGVPCADPEPPEPDPEPGAP